MSTKFEKLKAKIFERIQKMPDNVILRREINDLGNPSQINRCVRALIETKQLVKIGHGIYAKSYISQYSSKPLIKGGADNAWLEALTKLYILPCFFPLTWVSSSKVFQPDHIIHIFTPFSTVTN